MVRRADESTRRSQYQSPIRTLWAQAGYRIQRSSPESRSRSRKSDCLPERRGSAGNSHALNQSSAGGSGTAKQARRVHGQKSLLVAGLLCFLLLLAGCAHREQPPTMPAPPPAAPASTPAPVRIPTPTPTPVPKPAPAPVRPDAEIRVPKNAKVLYSEVGYASWYGPGF